MIYAAPSQLGTRPSAEPVKDRRMRYPVTPMSASDARVEPKGVERQADMFNPEFPRVFHQYPEHRRMQMQMQVAVHVIKRQAGSAKLFELGVNLSSELLAQSAPEKIPE